MERDITTIRGIGVFIITIGIPTVFRFGITPGMGGVLAFALDLRIDGGAMGTGADTIIGDHPSTDHPITGLGIDPDQVGPYTDPTGLG